MIAKPSTALAPIAFLMVAGFAGAVSAAATNGAEEAARAAETALDVLKSRTRESDECAEGFYKTETQVDGRYKVYECVRTMQCADGFEAELYEVGAENGRVIQRYRCKGLDKSQMIELERNTS